MTIRYIHCYKANDSITALYLNKRIDDDGRIDVYNLKLLLAECPKRTCTKADIVDYFVNSLGIWTADNWAENYIELINTGKKKEWIKYTEPEINYAISIPIFDPSNKELREWIFHIPRELKRLIDSKEILDNDDIEMLRDVNFETLSKIFNVKQKELLQEFEILRKLSGNKYVTNELLLFVFYFWVLPWSQKKSVNNKAKLSTLEFFNL